MEALNLKTYFRSEKNGDVRNNKKHNNKNGQAFLITDLFAKLSNKYQICDQELILGVLNDLINTGVVSLSEIDFGIWAYKSNLFSA